MNNLTIDTQAALRHFKEADPKMASMLKYSLDHENPIKIPTPKPTTQYFSTIVRSIVSQQISTKAADSIAKRLESKAPGFKAEILLNLKDQELRECGLSGPKVSYIKQNAEIFHTIPTKDFKYMEDAEVVRELTKLKGIGAWTAEMFLIFSLARPNVFSYGDLGLINSLLKQYGFYKHWNRKIENTVESWHPHKTLASLTLWHQIDNGPVLL